MDLNKGDEMEFTCKECGKVYKSKDGLVRHEKNHNGDEMKFTCKECGKI